MKDSFDMARKTNFLTFGMRMSLQRLVETVCTKALK